MNELLHCFLPLPGIYEQMTVSENTQYIIIAHLKRKIKNRTSALIAKVLRLSTSLFLTCRPYLLAVGLRTYHMVDIFLIGHTYSEQKK